MDNIIVAPQPLANRLTWINLYLQFKFFTHHLFLSWKGEKKIVDGHELLVHDINYSFYFWIYIYIHSRADLSFLKLASLMQCFYLTTQPCAYLVGARSFSPYFHPQDFLVWCVWLHPWLILNWWELKVSLKMRSAMKKIGTFHLWRPRSPMPHGRVAVPLINISLFQSRNWVSLPGTEVQ